MTSAMGDHMGDEIVLVDQQDRDVITGALDRNLFVEAGAGSGKTSSLVERIVNLVETDGLPVTRIAAITFTEAAARELRTRVRDAFENRGGQALEAAAAQVESAAFSTLHSFALRILSDHPIEAGLPPGFGVIDEITSTLEFDESWRIFVGRVGDDLSLLELQERAAAMNIDLRQFAGVARRFDDNWDLLELVTEEPPALTEISFTEVMDGLDELEALTDSCIAPDDLYLKALTNYIDQVNQQRPADPIEQLQTLRTLRTPAKNRGKALSWRDPGLPEVKERVAEFHRAMLDRVDRYRNEVMAHFITLVADFVSTRVEQRQRTGELAYHDLLVLSRRLLRSDEVVRQTLHQRYSRILLDEFQDTDPIQIELAVLLASAKPVGQKPWPELAADLPAGRLVVVGDPKQSIYRFRRADIGVYSRTEEVLVDQACRLTTNFRSVPGVLTWVNQVFAEAMGDGEPGKQPPYVPLTAAREPAPADGVPVTVLGGPHDKSVKIHQIREREGSDVAAVACRIMEEGWLVNRDDGWLPARLKDIAVLIPSRLSLPSLESAFAATNIPFRPETNSLVYATQEVRDVLAGVRAVVNPTNSVDVVATLRSALFAVGDDELLEWKLLGGSWDYRDPFPLVDVEVLQAAGAVLDGHRVADAYRVLRDWHDDRWWHDPATFIDRIVRDRRLREAALSEPRPRDRWRRYRFLAEQAREFTETQGGDLHDFVDWVEIQSSDMARVTEPIPAEPDDDAVRVLTIHGAKGLEFPIVILAGAPTEEARGRAGPQVIFPPSGRPEVKLGADRQTAEFDVHASMEELLDSYERIRLHYVAATRARDHLIVSAHHKEGRRSIGRRTWDASSSCPELWTGFEARGDEHYAAQPPTQLRLAGGGFDAELTEWTAIRRQIMETASAARHWSATSVAETARQNNNSSRLEITVEEGQPTNRLTVITGHGSADQRDPDSDVDHGRGGNHGSDQDYDRDEDHHRESGFAEDRDQEHGLDGDPADRSSGRGLVSVSIEDIAATDDAMHQEAIPGLEPPRGTVIRPDGGGAALGSAVHAALEVVDFDHPGDLDSLAQSCAAANGVPEMWPQVVARLTAALDAPTIQLARQSAHWRELYVAMPTGSGTVEGFVDLCIETEDGLVVVDYKTDQLNGDGAVAKKVENYRLQGATYAVALTHVTGLPVVACRFLFVGADEVIEADVEDLDIATAEVRQLLRLVESP